MAADREPKDDAQPPAQRVPASPASSRNPGDEAQPGSPQTAEQVCTVCEGTGRKDGSDCATCGGTGRVTVIVGEA